jgi:hypothetical protein
VINSFKLRSSVIPPDEEYFALLRSSMIILLMLCYFVELGKREEWVLIDLRPFRAPLAEGKLLTHRSAAHDIRHYDFILISPEDARVRALWK